MALASVATSLGSCVEQTKLLDNHGTKSSFTLPLMDFETWLLYICWPEYDFLVLPFSVDVLFFLHSPPKYWLSGLPYFVVGGFINLILGLSNFAMLTEILQPLIILLLNNWMLLAASCLFPNITKPYLNREPSFLPTGMYESITCLLYTSPSPRD